MEKLFSEFKPVSAAEWRARIEKDLKDIPFDSLLKTDRNGITIKPFYTEEDLRGEARPLFNSSEWEICARIVVNNEKEANREALNGLENGVSGICFIIGKQYDLKTLLDNISVQHIYLQFVVKENIAAFVTAFKNYLDAMQTDASLLNCTIVYDPIGSMIGNGTFTAKRTEQLTFILNTQNTPDFRSLSVDGSIYQNAGATPSFELACTLAHLNEYLNWLNENNSLALAKKIHVTLSTGTDFFEEISKLRAFRKLAALVFETYNIHPDLHLHCETSDVYRSPFDSYTNLLRDSISGMAAVLGGCSSLAIHAFNGAAKEHDPFSTRMSRNQQLIFKEESYLDKVADVAAGSFYIEALTEEIAEKAWEAFREIENKGGLLQYAENGKLNTNIEKQATELVEAYKSGKRVLIGVNKFPNPTDMPVKQKVKSQKEKGLKALSLANELLVPQEVNA